MTELNFLSEQFPWRSHWWSLEVQRITRQRYFSSFRDVYGISAGISLLYTIPSIFEPCELSPNTELHWRNSFCLSATLEYWIDGMGANRENTGAMESHCYYTDARYCTFFFVSFFTLSSFVPTSYSICQVVTSKSSLNELSALFRRIS